MSLRNLPLPFYKYKKRPPDLRQAAFHMLKVFETL